MTEEQESMVLDVIKILKAKPCEDCVSRKAVLDKINEVCFSKEQKWVEFRVSHGSNGQRNLIINFIESLPPVAPKPKTGKWINRNGNHYGWLECSLCGYGSNGELTSDSGVTFSFCPHCGAKMEEAIDDEKMDEIERYFFGDDRDSLTQEEIENLQ